MNRWTRVAMLALLGCALATGAVLAQETTGSIIGTVTSQDGATLPGVTVTSATRPTGFERTTITGTNGRVQVRGAAAGASTSCRRR